MVLDGLWDLGFMANTKFEMKRKLTFAFVGFFGCGSPPWPIKMERFAFFAVPSGRVVPAIAAEQSVPPDDAF